MVPIAADWSDWVGVMVTTHFGLVSDLFWAPRNPKRTPFGRKCPFWGSWRDSEGPREPHLVATAADRSDWVGIMVTTPFGLVLGHFLAPRGPKWARFGPEYPFWGSWRYSESPEGPDLVPTPTGCCAWVGLMVTRDFGLVSGLFLAARGSKRALLL